MKTKPKLHKHFKCKKCGKTYDSPISISDVICGSCTKGADVFMEPVE